MNSIEIKNLSLNFGDVKVLKDLNLTIEKGEFLVLLGASGCGKSTLLNCIAGLLDVTDGQIFINEQNVTWLEPAQRVGIVVWRWVIVFGARSPRQPRVRGSGRQGRRCQGAGRRRRECAESRGSARRVWKG